MPYSMATHAASFAAASCVASVKYQASSSSFLPDAVYVAHSTPIVFPFLASGWMYEKPLDAPTCQSLSVTSAAW